MGRGEEGAQNGHDMGDGAHRWKSVHHMISPLISDICQVLSGRRTGFYIFVSFFGHALPLLANHAAVLFYDACISGPFGEASG